jgi:crotonobetainyl-CoA:carnitine CoA-transferase CaiB-like acyl-CoA transferase
LTAQTRPLEDIVVLDCTHALSGPYCTLLLAGLGARVIKIENPEGGDVARNNPPYLNAKGIKGQRETDEDVSLAVINRLRNKESVTLNLKHPAGRELFTELVKKADVVVENMSRFTIDKLGVGYEAMSKINPRIIYCSISGFGREGDAGGGKAMDAIVQALSGIMYVSGEEGSPPVRVGLPIGDMSAPVFAVVGVLSALHQRERTGRGQLVDISMLGVLTGMLACEPFDVLEDFGLPSRTGLHMARLAPFGMFPTNDGGYVALAASNQHFAAGVMRAMGRPELIEDPRFRTRDLRVKNNVEIHRIIEEWSKTVTLDEAVAALEREGVPSSRVRHPREAFRDPLVVKRGETAALHHPKFGQVMDIQGMGIPIKFSDAFAGLDRPPPMLGQHNQAIYGDLLGRSADELSKLKSEGAI